MKDQHNWHPLIPFTFLFVFWAMVGIILLSACTADAAGTANFKWSPNSEVNLGGYMIHYGQASGDYSTHADCGLPATEEGWVYCSIDLLLDADDPLFFALTAYNKSHGHSGYSNEIEYSPVPGIPANFQGADIVIININQ